MKKLLIAILTSVAATAQTPTVDEASKFMDAAEARLLQLTIDSSRADWVKSTFITYDTEILSAKADEINIAATVELAKKATRFDHLKLPADLSRRFELLKLNLTLATPSNAAEAEELTQIVSQMEGTYGKGKYCSDKKPKCLDIDDLSNILRTSTNPDELRDAWTGWHKISVPMRGPFQKYVALANKGARELGFADTGAMWRAKYDMPPDAFAAEVDRLWNQVKPLYLSLHAYVRSKLREKYGDLVPANGPIPADLLGNMWAQEWENIYPLVAPKSADPGYDLTAILKSARSTR